MFRARLPSLFITSNKMPRLPWNLHLVATWRSPDNAIRKNTQHDTSKVLRLPCKMTTDTSKVLHLPQKLQRIFWKHRKSIAPATQNDFPHVTKHVWMSRSATPATRTKQRDFSNFENDQEWPLLQNLPKARPYGHHADGCERLRTVASEPPKSTLLGPLAVRGLQVCVRGIGKAALYLRVLFYTPSVSCLGARES